MGFSKTFRIEGGKSFSKLQGTCVGLKSGSKSANQHLQSIGVSNIWVVAIKRHKGPGFRVIMFRVYT